MYRCKRAPSLITQIDTQILIVFRHGGERNYRPGLTTTLPLIFSNRAMFRFGNSSFLILSSILCNFLNKNYNWHYQLRLTTFIYLYFLNYASHSIIHEVLVYFAIEWNAICCYFEAATFDSHAKQTKIYYIYMFISIIIL